MRFHGLAALVLDPLLQQFLNKRLGDTGIEPARRRLQRPLYREQSRFLAQRLHAVASAQPTWQEIDVGFKLGQMVLAHCKQDPDKRIFNRKLGYDFEKSTSLLPAVKMPRKDFLKLVKDKNSNSMFACLVARRDPTQNFRHRSRRKLP